MRHLTFLGLALLPALAVACSDQPITTFPDDALLSRAPGAGPAESLQNFGGALSGDQEVPPVDTRARGMAHFQLSKDGTELHFQLIVANLMNVTQAHIHCGAPGVNGPVVLFLYPDGPPATLIPGRSSGVLGHGIATNDDLIARPHSEECPGGVANLDDLIEKMQTGEAYTNVHTTQHEGGEIRGLIEARGR